MSFTKSVVVFLSEGFEEIEAVSPIDYLRRAGCSVTTVKVEAVTKAAILEGKHISNDKYAVSAAHGVTFIADTSLDEYLANKELPDAVFIPGGMPGATNIAASEKVCDFLKKMFMANKLVTAICAAPVVVLAKCGILANKNYTCYPEMENMLENFCGKNWKELTEKAIHHKDKAFVTDANLVTGRGPGAAEEFAMEIVRLLCGEETAKKVHDSSCQR
ncbi:MAG: DJ-1/PfpI family protein [Treponema sp.]|nr:DJ-1/PfpI family protein [Treponema sp.]